MKIAVTAILALAGAATVVAIDYPPNMPECGVSIAVSTPRMPSYTLLHSSSPTYMAR
jgi:hypothetical protein